MSEWISVKKTEPPLDREFLSWDGNSIRVSEFLFINCEGEFIWITGSYCFTHLTHWMPLPHPPKENNAMD